MKHLPLFLLAAKHWLNDLRSNEKRLLILATLLAAVSMSMISSFSDRLSRTMQYRASELIAADLTIFSSRKINDEFITKAAELGLRHSQALGFSTMAFANDQLQLVRVRSVQENYPLKGYNQLANEFYGKGLLIKAAPAPGKVWAEERILQKLKVNIGDAIEIGESVLQIEKILQQDADRSGSLFSPFGRLLMSRQDVAKTGVIGEGSRIWYKHYYAGSEEALADFSSWLAPRLDDSQTLGGIKDAQQSVGGALGKAQQYLSLASLISVLLAAVAIALCAQRYSERHFNTAALLRCLGASRKQVRAIFVYKLMLTALLGAVCGALIGFVLHFALLALVADILPQDLMPARFTPVLVSMLCAALVLMLIALAPILNLHKVSPARVLRRELKPKSVQANVFFVLAVVLMVGLAFLLTKSLMLSLVFVVGLALLLLIYGLLSSAMLAGLMRVQRYLPSTLRLGLTQLNRHRYYARSQIAAFAFIFTSVALIWIVRGDLFDNWQSQVPQGTPNHFAINILPAQKDDFALAMSNKGLTTSDFYPMVRGRLTHINNVAVSDLFKEDAGPAALKRELNLTWSDTLRLDEAITDGHWFDDIPAGSPPEVNWVSLEEELARRLNVSIGDDVSFNLAGQTLVTKVASLRSVKWDNFRPNFYVVFTPQVLSQFHHTFINSFYLPPQEGRWLLRLNQQFKAVTVIEIEQILVQVRQILAQTSLAVEAILLLVLLCAMVLMFATLLSTLNLRKHEAALYRTFGASEATIRGRIRSEYITLALVSSLLALLSFEGISLALYVIIFKVSWQPHVSLWLMVPLLALGSILLAGFYANRDVLKASPRQLLQEIN
ncbi:MAG: FtsX-like permease family protein [Bermanella sp.]